MKGVSERWYCSRIKACGWNGAQAETKPVRGEVGNLVTYTDTCPKCGHESFYIQKDGKPPKGWKPKAPSPTGTEAAVCEDIARRQQLGLVKYGVSVADNPLSLKDWLTAQYEELLDAAVYCKRAIEELERKQP